MKTPGRTMLAFGLGMLAGLAAPSAWAQPAPPEPAAQDAPPPRPDGQRRPELLDRAAVRARMERRLEEARRMEDRLEAAIKRLDEGEPLADVMSELAGEMVRRGGPPEGAPPQRPMPGQAGPRPAEGRPDPVSRRERVREFLRAHMPVIAEEWRKAENQNPASVERLVGWMFPQLGELEAARQRDAVLFERRLDEVRASLAMGKAMRDLRDAAMGPGATPAGIDAGLDTLRGAIAAQFDARLAVQAREIELLSERVDRLRAELDSQKAVRDERIDQRVRDAREFIRKRRDQPGQPRGRGEPGPG